MQFLKVMIILAIFFQKLAEKCLWFVSNTNKTYDYFLQSFPGIGNLAFSSKVFTIKRKNSHNPWMTRSFLKWWKQKQKILKSFKKQKCTKRKKIRNIKSLCLKFLNVEILTWRIHIQRNAHKQKKCSKIYKYPAQSQLSIDLKSQSYPHIQLACQ